ncbi:discoidin domain-containing protein [Actinocrinis puniceicyclus]|uniref:Discoidin domain-containing protein n=1 Tax=Actinocrinis puniceicyclus TaxID=977794 RepID=A0A8J7WTZ0_9ACTN|nr:discoidin domain-containing protein [Actinocrinis puniceicyclus]MBS2965685.1 discoidin domain-containing protein [Actinocrinis puniceicyclus]
MPLSRSGETVRPIAPAEAARSAADTAVPSRGRRVLRGVAAPRIVTFARQRARYIRVTLAPQGAEGDPLCIRTLSVTDSSRPTVDLAVRRPVSGSGAGCAAVVDGNPGTRWSPAARDPSPWLRIDLGESMSFDRVCLMPDRDGVLDGPVRVAVCADGVRWTEPETVDDPFAPQRADFGAALPQCPGGYCEPLHTQLDGATWQVYAVNHTAMRVTAASVVARVYEPFGGLLNHAEHHGITIEPLSIAPSLVVPWPRYLPVTHLLSLELHDADGALLSEHNHWRYQGTPNQGTPSAGPV